MVRVHSLLMQLLDDCFVVPLSPTVCLQVKPFCGQLFYNYEAEQSAGECPDELRSVIRKDEAGYSIRHNLIVDKRQCSIRSCFLRYRYRPVSLAFLCAMRRTN